MGDDGSPEPGSSRQPRQHAFPTPVAPPSGNARWGPGGPGTWGRPADQAPGASGWSRPGGPAPGNGGWGRPADRAPGGSGTGSGNGWWGGGRRPAPAPRRSSGTRGLLWTAAIVAVVVLLQRAHRITTGEIIVFCIMVPSLILHEVSHGAVALAFGDDTAKRAGRLSLNPLRHVDVVGTIIVPAITVLSGFGFFGWAKPVPVDVRRLRSPRNQGLVVSLAGPFTNLVLAAAGGLVFYYAVVANRVVAVTSTTALVLFYVGFVNLWVACFNLVPIPPLDGSAVLERLLPAAWWPGYLRIRPYGLFVIFGGLMLLSLVHVDPLGGVVRHLETWWAHLVGV